MESQKDRSRNENSAPAAGAGMAATPANRAPAAADCAGQSRLNGVRLGFLIHDVSRMRRHAFDALMKPFGVTRAQWWVLAHLSRDDGMMQTQLADTLDVGKASLGTVLERLEHNELIERRADPADRRARRVYLTRRARALIVEMLEVEHRFNDTLLGDFSGPQVEALIDRLHTLKVSLSAY